MSTIGATGTAGAASTGGAGNTGNTDKMRQTQGKAAGKTTEADKLNVVEFEVMHSTDIPTDGDPKDKDKIPPNKPELSKPDPSQAGKLNDWVGIPSPGLIILALVVKLSGEQRQQNTEKIAKQTKLEYENAKKEAEEMRKTAQNQLIMGLVSAGISMASGFAQFAVVSFGGGSFMNKDHLKLMEPVAQAIGTGVGSIGKVADAAQQSIGTAGQARLKELEADQNRLRAEREVLKEQNAALKELIAKGLSTSSDVVNSNASLAGKLNA